MEKVKQYFLAAGAPFLVERIQVFEDSSATVLLAAERLNCRPAHIAKSVSLQLKKQISREENKNLQKNNDNNEKKREVIPIVVLTAGDAKIDNKKFKEKFSIAPKLLKREEVEALTGFAPGGVSPFALNENVLLYFDISLKRFKKVFPAAGSDNSGIGLTIEELETYGSHFVEWVNVCSAWEETDLTGDDNVVE